MKNESNLWILITVLCVIVIAAQADKVQQVQSRNYELEAINQSQKLALERASYDQAMAQ